MRASGSRLVASAPCGGRAPAPRSRTRARRPAAWGRSRASRAARRAACCRCGSPGAGPPARRGSAAARGRGRRRGRRAAAGSAAGASFDGGPQLHHLVEAHERRIRSGRPRPQALQDAGRDRVGHRLVGQRLFSFRAGASRSTSSAARSASASSSRAAPSPFQWASAAASCSLSYSGKVIFSTARRAVAPLGGDDERDRGRLERVAQPQIPLLGALRREAGKRGEPLRPPVLRPPPAQPVRHAHAL